MDGAGKNSFDEQFSRLEYKLPHFMLEDERPLSR